MSANGQDAAATNGRSRTAPANGGPVEDRDPLGYGEPANGRGRSRRFIRRGNGSAPGSGEGAAEHGLAGLQAELTLLREENARLAQAQHQPPRVAGLLRRAGSGRAQEPVADDPGDELAQLLADYAVMRETLLVACDEMESALGALRTRLAALPAPDAAGAEPELEAGPELEAEPGLEAVAEPEAEAAPELDAGPEPPARDARVAQPSLP